MTLKTERLLLEALDQCRLKTVRSLIATGRNIHSINEHGQNVLVHLIQQQSQDDDPGMKKKRFRIFQYLIRQINLDIHRIDSFGKNLFNWIANLNCTDEGLYLLRLYPGDIDLLHRDHFGSCALHYAVEHGNDLLVRSIVHYLLRYRLRFDIKDVFHCTPEDLARKLGYDSIAQFLAQASKSTNYLSRELPSPSLPPITFERPKRLALITDPSEYFSWIEQRIQKAKRVEDWKAVIALRAFKRPLNKKSSYKPQEPLPTIRRKSSSVIEPRSSLTNLSRLSQSEQMLHLCEFQLSPSYRLPFAPSYPRIVHCNTGSPNVTNGQRKLSQASSRRISSVSSHRKRDSEVSQISLTAIQDLQNRLSLPVIHKQQRSSIVTAH